MNSRARVSQSLTHQEPDRIPTDVGGMRSTGIHSVACRNLRNHLGMAPDSVKVFDIWQQLGLVDQDLLEYFDADTTPLVRLEPAFGIRVDR